MAEAVALHLVVAHLDHELRPDRAPPRARPCPSGSAPRSAAPTPRRASGSTRAATSSRVSRRDGARADVVEPAVVAVEAEQQRRDRLAVALPADADDDAVGRLVLLHLDHRRRASRAGTATPSRFATTPSSPSASKRSSQPARLVERRASPARAGSRSRRASSSRAPLLERPLPHRLAVPEQHVEDDVLGRDLRRQPADARLGRMQPHLHRVEVERAVARRSRSRRRAPSAAAAARRAAAAPGSSAAAAARCATRARARRRRSRARRGSRPTSARTASRRPPAARGRARPPSAGTGCVGHAGIGPKPTVKLVADEARRGHRRRRGHAARARRALDVARRARRRERDRLDPAFDTDGLPGADRRRGEGLRPDARSSRRRRRASSSATCCSASRAGREALADAGLERLRPDARRDHLRLGDRRRPRDPRAGRHPARARARPRLAELPAERARRLGVRAARDLARDQGPELRGRLGLRDRLARGRRGGRDDQARRRRRGARRRHRGVHRSR